MVTFFQRVRNTFTPTERSQWMREWLQPWLGLDSSDRSIDQLHWDADFVLSNSSCRYPWNFFVHDGKSSASSGKGVGYTSVIKLLDGNVLGKGYRLYADNIYTSPTLFSEMLKNSIFACGTLSHNSNLSKVNDLGERSERGSIRWSQKGPLLFVKWRDAREVLMCSTIHKAFTDNSVSRHT